MHDETLQGLKKSQSKSTLSGRFCFYFFQLKYLLIFCIDFRAVFRSHFHRLFQLRWQESRRRNILQTAADRPPVGAAH